jgi:hypothetical protein
MKGKEEGSLAAAESDRPKQAKERRRERTKEENGEAFHFDWQVKAQTRSQGSAPNLTAQNQEGSWSNAVRKIYGHRSCFFSGMVPLPA